MRAFEWETKTGSQPNPSTTGTLQKPSPATDDASHKDGLLTEDGGKQDQDKSRQPNGDGGERR